MILDRAVRGDRAPPPASGLTLDHVGVAVPDAKPLQEIFQPSSGFAPAPSEDIGPHRLRFVDTGTASIELVEPLTADAPIAKFLAKREARCRTTSASSCPTCRRCWRRCASAGCA